MKRYMMFTLFCLAVCGGCFSLKTEHKVEPIHITMDINVKVQQDLEAFLDLDD